MRWSDEYLGLLAAALAFGAVVFQASGLAWYGPAGLALLAVAALAAMGWRAMRTPKVAVVGGPRHGRLYRLHDALDDAGFAVRTCPGPGHRPCPVVEGRPCPVRGHPVAAVIYTEAGSGERIPPCGPALRAPVLALEEDSRAGPSVGRKRATIGWGRGPDAAVGALRDLLAAWRANPWRPQ